MFKNLVRAPQRDAYDALKKKVEAAEGFRPPVPLSAHATPRIVCQHEQHVEDLLREREATLRCQHGNSTTQLRSDRARDSTDAAHLITWAVRLHADSRKNAAIKIRAIVAVRAYCREAAHRQRMRQGRAARIACRCTAMLPPRHVLQFHAKRPPKRCVEIS